MHLKYLLLRDYSFHVAVLLFNKTSTPDSNTPMTEEAVVLEGCSVLNILWDFSCASTTDLR